jgi:hypothetical protein
MRTKVASLCLLLVLVPLSAGADVKKARSRKAPEFSATDPKETLLWLASVGNKFSGAFSTRDRNELARQKKLKDAQDEFNKAIGKEVTWSLAVAKVDSDGIYISGFRLPGVALVKVRPVHDGIPYFTRYDGSKDWLLSLKEGDAVKVIGEVEDIKWSGGSRNNAHVFYVYLKNAVVKPKD